MILALCSLVVGADPTSTKTPVGPLRLVAPKRLR